MSLHFTPQLNSKAVQRSFPVLLHQPASFQEHAINPPEHEMLALFDDFDNNGKTIQARYLNMSDQLVADFVLPATGGVNFKLSAARGKSLVIYFYPKDNTPGCTAESQQFRDLYAEFTRAGCEVVGVSRDSVKSHENFKTRFSLPFALLSDSEEKVCEQFAVMKLKNMYGKQVRGIERSTFVLDKHGVLRREWRGIKADGHAQEILQFVQSLSASL